MYDSFQNTLKSDLTKIRNEKKVIVAADKTTNFYKLEKEDYNKLLHNNITQNYKKANDDIIEVFNKDDKKVTDKLDISDRVDSISPIEAFIQLKDTKENFQNNPKCRLINPTKTELGRISKMKIENIVKIVKEKTGLNQFKNTQSAIAWFQDIPRGQNVSFIQFDICEYYPSISPDLLDKSLNYAANYTTITPEDRELFFQVDLLKRGSMNIPLTETKSAGDIIQALVIMYGI